MRPRTLAALFVLVAGLLAFIWFFERDLPSSEERVVLEKRVLRLEAEAVQGLTLDRNGNSVRLERVAQAAGAEEDEASWRLGDPLDALADRVAVDQLVDELIGLEKDRTLESIDPAELGLAEPRGRVTVDTDAGPVELLIGSAVPASSTMILGVTGRDEAYVVADSLWRELEKPAGDWRSRDLGPQEPPGDPTDRARPQQRAEVASPSAVVAIASGSSRPTSTGRIAIWCRACSLRSPGCGRRASSTRRRRRPSSPPAPSRWSSTGASRRCASRSAARPA